MCCSTSKNPCKVRNTLLLLIRDGRCAPLSQLGGHWMALDTRNQGYLVLANSLTAAQNETMFEQKYFLKLVTDLQ